MRVGVSYRSGSRPLPRVAFPIWRAQALWFLALATLTLAPGAAYSQTPPLTIQPSTSKVGIRTTNPNGVLSVQGDGTSPALEVMDATSATRFVVSPAGHVGIGTAAPNLNNWGSDVTATTIEGAGWAALELAGTQAADGALVGGVLFHNRATEGGRIAGISGVRIGNNSAGYLAFHITPRNQPPGSLQQRMYLDDTGIYVTGAKSFEIEHPLDPTKRLVHAAIEGPEVAVYYRGEARLHDGQATVRLPAYFEALTTTEQRCVQLTSLDGWSPLYVEGGVRGGQFVVRTAKGGAPTQKFYWEVKAVRKTATPMQVERSAVAGTSRIGASTLPAVQP